MKPESTDDVFDLMNANITATALNTALELGLFWLLDEQPLDLNEIARVLDIPINRCHYWLQLLKFSGLLELSSAGYIPSPTAKTSILQTYSQETWAFLAREQCDRFLALNNLPQNIHEPGSTWAVQGLIPPDYFAQISQDPDRARRFTRMLYEIHLPFAEVVADALDVSGVDKLMDLGGGSGVVSLALLRRYPQLTAVVVDIPNVCIAGREIAHENSMEDRITYLASNFVQDELPSGFGMVLQCDVGSYSRELFRKIQAALHPGGRLVIVDHFAPTTGVAPSAWLYWAFLASLATPSFTLPTVTETQDQLIEAGFQPLPAITLPSSEVHRWSTDWILLEASK